MDELPWLNNRISQDNATSSQNEQVRFDRQLKMKKMKIERKTKNFKIHKEHQNAKVFFRQMIKSNLSENIAHFLVQRSLL